MSELCEAARVYQRVPIGNIVKLWKRRLRLSACRLLPKPAPAAPLPGRPRVVISLTTIPSRIGRIKTVLNSLIDQTVPADDILLAVPGHSRREGCGYRLPPFLAESTAVSVLACDDWGPATKLIPTLLQERDPSTLILAVDDDTIYPPDLVANLPRLARAAARCRAWPARLGTARVARLAGHADPLRQRARRAAVGRRAHRHLGNPGPAAVLR